MFSVVGGIAVNWTNLWPPIAAEATGMEYLEAGRAIFTEPKEGVYRTHGQTAQKRLPVDACLNAMRACWTKKFGTLNKRHLLSFPCPYRGFNISLAML